MKKRITILIVLMLVAGLGVGSVSGDGAVSWSNPDMGSGGSAVSWDNPDMGYGGSAVSWDNPDMGYGGSAVSWLNAVEFVCFIFGQEYYTAFSTLENNMYGTPDWIIDTPVYDADGNEINCHPQVFSKHKEFVDVGINGLIVYGRIDFYWKSTKENVNSGELYVNYTYSGCAYFAYSILSPFRSIYIPVGI